MEQLLHFLGLCPDHMSHPNVIMFLSSATGGWFGLKYIYYRWFKKYKTINHDVKSLYPHLIDQNAVQRMIAKIKAGPTPYGRFAHKHNHNCSHGCEETEVTNENKSKEEKQVSVNWTAWERNEKEEEEYQRLNRRPIDSESLQAQASQAY